MTSRATPPAPRARAVAGRPRSTAAIQVILGFVAVLYLLELADSLLGNRLDAAGVEPRDVDGLDGILFAPLLHGGWGHLVANTVPLLVLGFFVLLDGIARWATVTAVVWLVGGVGTWLTGGEGTLHLGASVLVFGWLVYLLLRGLWSGEWRQLLLGVVLLAAYGGVLFGVLPGTPGVSWQGHLFGAVGGVVAARAVGMRDRSTRAAKRVARRSAERPGSPGGRSRGPSARR